MSKSFGSPNPGFIQCQWFGPGVHRNLWKSYQPKWFGLKKQFGQNWPNGFGQEIRAVLCFAKCKPHTTPQSPSCHPKVNYIPPHNHRHTSADATQSQSKEVGANCQKLSIDEGIVDIEVPDHLTLPYIDQIREDYFCHFIPKNFCTNYRFLCNSIAWQETMTEQDTTSEVRII